MSIINRIYSLCDEKGKTLYALCKQLGISQSTMSTWKSRDSDIPSGYLETISKFLGISIDQLVTGREYEPPRYTTEEEDEVLELLRTLPDKEKYIFIGRLEEAHSKIHEKYLDEEQKSSVSNGTA